MTETTFSYIKDADQESYDLIFRVAQEWTSSNGKDTFMWSLGALMFSFLNQWETGVVRDIKVINKFYDVATSWELSKRWDDDQELVEMVADVLMEDLS